MKLLSPESINKPSVYEISGKEFKIEGYTISRNTETNERIFIPVVDIPMVSDYKWQLDCLNDRLNHPEKYEDTEDVPATIERIKKWLEEHTPQ